MALYRKCDRCKIDLYGIFYKGTMEHSGSVTPYEWDLCAACQKVIVNIVQTYEPVETFDPRKESKYG